MIIRNDDEFREAEVSLQRTWALIDSSLILINGNLRVIRRRPWKLIGNFKLLRENKYNLRFINELLMSNMDLIEAREAYVRRVYGDGEDTTE